MTVTSRGGKDGISLMRTVLGGGRAKGLSSPLCSGDSPATHPPSFPSLYKGEVQGHRSLRSHKLRVTSLCPSPPRTGPPCFRGVGRDGKRKGHAQQWGLLTVLCCLHRLHAFEATAPVTALLRTLTVPVAVTLGWLSPDAAYIVRWANSFFLLVVEEVTR